MTTYRELKNEIENKYLTATRLTDMRFYLLGLMALETGARVSDLLVLEFTAVDGNVISYRNKKSKKMQNQNISTNLASYIERYKDTIIELQQFNNSIFFNPSKKATLSRVTANRRTQKEFGLNFHQLRKESGRNIASQKGVVLASRFLGHSRVSTTDLYLSVSDNDYLTQMKGVEI